MFESELDRLKGLIEFAIEKRLKEFKYDGFEFILSGIDPTEERIQAIEERLDQLQELANKLHLAQSFKKAG